MSPAGTMVAIAATSSDEQLVAAVRDGDDRAYEALYERYQRRIHVYILGMVGDHGRAEDLTQDVFVSALRRMRKTDRPIAFKPWIYEIAKNACIDQYRRSRRTEEVSFDIDGGACETAELSTPAALPEAAVDQKQQLSDLCGAFGGLSDTHHQILVLRELEGLSYAEIAERLGMSRPSVESTLFRARRRLTEEYGELVSGERCRAVQSMLATGRIGRRDERRVARHVAHCAPCRRQAHLAGRDFVATRRSVAVAKVSALLPLPAFLRFRRGGGLSDNSAAALANWSQSVATVAEPAAGWGKALVATLAVVTAGGAGAVAHHRPDPLPLRAPVSQVKPLHQAVGEHARDRRTVHAAPAPRHARTAKPAAPVKHRIERAQVVTPAVKSAPTTKTGTTVGDAPRSPAATPAPDPLAVPTPLPVDEVVKTATRPPESPDPATPAPPPALTLPPDSQAAIDETGGKVAAAVEALKSQISAPVKLGSVSVLMDADAAFLESLMDTSLYSLGAAFQDDHPELVDEVIAQADTIESVGLEAWAAEQEMPLQSAFQTLVTGLALRYYRALGA